MRSNANWDACDGLLWPWEWLPGIERADEPEALRAIKKHGLVLYRVKDEPDTPEIARHNVGVFTAWRSKFCRATTTRTGGDNKPWITKAVSDELAELRSAGRGSRNSALNNVALRLARLQTDRNWLHGELIDACEANGLIADDGLASVEATIRSAFGKADHDGPAPIPMLKAGALATSKPADRIDDFWSARPVLAHILKFARSRMVGPWGTLGSVLVRAVCQLPPEVLLPSTVGDPASLNLLLALVGGSGGGKGGCEAVGRAAIFFRNGVHEIDELPLGSGEGLAKSLSADDGQGSPVIFTASEIDSVAALFTRRGSTLEPELRKLYSGETLGFTNAQKHTRTKVAAHSYRACLITGVQPTRGTFLLNGADAGTPQRFLWLPVDDPGAPDVTPHGVATLTIDAPEMFGPGANMVTADRSEIVVPETITRQVRSHRLDVLRSTPGVDPLDGHRMLCRLKVSAALMALDGRNQIIEEDWHLAGTVLAVSDHTREMVARAGSEKARQSNLARARAEVERDEYISASKLQSAKQGVLRRLNKAEGAAVARNDLRRALRSDRREYFDPAIIALMDERLLHEVKLPNGVGYRGGQE